MNKMDYIRMVFVFLPLVFSFPVYSATPTVNSDSSDTLVIGIFPRRDPAVTVALFKPLVKYLKNELSLNIKLETAANYDIFSKRLQQRRYDLVHLNQFHYVQAHRKLNYQALLQNEEFGEKNIRGAIYVHVDSGIENIQQLKNKKILFGGGKAAMMSYIVPTFLLRQGGIKAGEYEELFAVSPPNAVLATFLRHTDAGGAGEIARRLPLVTKKIDITQLRLLAVSEPLSHLPWAVKSEMHESLKTKLKKVMTAMDESSLGREVLTKARLTALNPASDSDYDEHRKIINKVNHEK